MDAHYEQVMKARKASEGAPPRRYFGYSTVLDRAAFDEWKGQHGYDAFALPAGQLAEAVDVDLTCDFPSRWWGGRVAGLIDRPGSRVMGVVFEIPGVDWPIVQHKEGAVTGMSVEREVRVVVDGKELTATAFVTHPARKSSDGPVSARFLEALVRGARSAGLPEAYVARLSSLA